MIQKALCLLNTLNQSINFKETAAFRGGESLVFGGIFLSFLWKTPGSWGVSRDAFPHPFFVPFTLRAYFLYANKLDCSSTREGISLLSSLVCIFLIGFADCRWAILRKKKPQNQPQTKNKTLVFFFCRRESETSPGFPQTGSPMFWIYVNLINRLFHSDSATLKNKVIFPSPFRWLLLN